MHTGPKLKVVYKLSGSPDAEHRTVRCSPDLNSESSAKRSGHRTHTTGHSKLRSMLGVWCLTLTEPGCLHTGRTDTASGASRPASGECFLVRNTPTTSPKFSTSAIENIHFIFSKAPNPEEPILSLPFKLHLLLKVCQHHKVCTNKCTCVSIFTIIFFEGVKLAH